MGQLPGFSLLFCASRFIVIASGRVLVDARGEAVQSAAVAVASETRAAATCVSGTLYQHTLGQSLFTFTAALLIRPIILCILLPVQRSNRFSFGFVLLWTVRDKRASLST